MRMERFRIEDIDRIGNFGGQDDLVRAMPRDQIAAVIQSGNHYSLYSGDYLAACFGFVPANGWRCMGWTLLQSGAPELFSAIHKPIKQAMIKQPWARIEAYVDPTSERAMRWVRLLGFTLETPPPYKPFFFPDGRTAAEWAFYNRVR